MKKISVIVPIYNVAPYLRTCLDSLLDQTYTDYEIICVDDGSKDESGRIADEYASLYSNIHVIHKENGGLSSARNAGLKIATGEYISFIDSDDYVASNYLAEMAKALDEGYDYAECMNTAFDETGKKWEYGYQSSREISEYDYATRPDLLIHVAMFVRGNMYRRELIEGVLFPEGLVHEDIYYSSILFSTVKKIKKVMNTEYYYLIRSDSIANHASIKMFDMYQIMQEIHEYYETHKHPYPLLLSKTYVRTFMVAVLFHKAAHLSSEHHSTRKEMCKKAYRDLQRFYPEWAKNPLITPKEKIAVRLLAYPFLMEMIWKGAK
ncbi:MAG: glycosyltransferase [Erysipelotrichales bacterium]|nr:glycosyltransferase [Erysipelotrichales bacterium]